MPDLVDRLKKLDQLRADALANIRNCVKELRSIANERSPSEVKKLITSSNVDDEIKLYEYINTLQCAIRAMHCYVREEYKDDR